MPEYDVILAGGHVLDPRNRLDGRMDLAISGGKVERVEPEIDHDLASEVVDVSGKWLMPGMIDTHVHVAGSHSTWDPALGYRMLAAAGTTTAIDFGGTPETLIDGMQRMGSGMNVGGLYVMVPGQTIPRDDPPPAEVRRIVSEAVSRGALGIKMIGGYYPFTPEVTATIIAECNRQRAYIGFHLGTKESGSRLDGLREVPALVGNGRLHVAHVNAYCRGSIKRPVEECEEAIQILTARREHYVSEVHQAVPNGTSGRCDLHGNVEADVARNCLKLRNYPTTADGIRQAIKDGYASVIREKDHAVVYVGGREALAMFDELETDCPLSFPVNLPATAFHLTTAKDRTGEFVVDAIATDGGSHPRNIAIESTMALVKFGALSPLEMATKLSWNPARMFALPSKGHLGVGADADVTVIDPAAGKATMAIVDGKPIMRDGRVLGSGGRLLVTEAGRKVAEASGLPFQVLDLTSSKLYAGYGG
ncbi:MAG: amidohydrolase family protein [SAR202 cluster bacterium]|nr:amidohydrolase family protein [SAR202 cluster bacterium]